MLNFVIGGFVALVFLGLPLAIIALFVASFLEKRPSVSERNSVAVGVPPTPDHAADYRHDKRRRIVYGRHPVIAAKLPEREESMRPQDAKV
jgi:hypothetical protein